MIQYEVYHWYTATSRKNTTIPYLFKCQRILKLQSRHHGRTEAAQWNETVKLPHHWPHKIGRWKRKQELLFCWHFRVLLDDCNLLWMINYDYAGFQGFFTFLQFLSCLMRWKLAMSPHSHHHPLHSLHLHGLIAFFAANANPHVGTLDHGHVIGSITNG